MSKESGQKNLVHSVVLRGTQQIELFFNRIHWVPARPRRAASRRVESRCVALVRTRYNFSACCRWRISIFAAVRPADIADRHKTIIVVECIRLWRRYNLPGLAVCLTGWTWPRLTLHPNTLHIVRSACDVYYDNFCVQKRFTVIYACP